MILTGFSNAVNIGFRKGVTNFPSALPILSVTLAEEKKELSSYKMGHKKRGIMLFPGYLPTYTAPISEPLLNMNNPWNKCPKRGFLTTSRKIPIGKHYRSFIKSRFCKYLYIY